MVERFLGKKEVGSPILPSGSKFKFMKDCVYCNLPEIKERTIANNGLAWAFPTNIPITPGHVLICPVRHVETFDEMTPQDVEAVFRLRDGLKKAIRDLFGAEGFHYAWNENKVAGQGVPHFHLHVVPRKVGDSGITESEPRKFLYRPGSRETTPEGELSAIARQIRTKLDDLA